jgi:beta-xylosidase
LVWQWNHNPDNDLWSVADRKGYLRLRTSRIDSSLVSARNTLTQRTIGPESNVTTLLETAQMKEGDFAGLCLLQKEYGWVGVTVKDGERSVVMVHAPEGNPQEIQRIPIRQDKVYFRASCDFGERADTGNFQYSLDGKKWEDIGKSFPLLYTLPHFMGYRYGLFNFATKETGGHADFDYFRIMEKIQ